MQGTGIFGSIAAVSMGVYYNREIHSGSKSGSKTDVVNRYTAYRNAGYIAGVVLAAGVTVSFFF